MSFVGVSVASVTGEEAEEGEEEEEGVSLTALAAVLLVLAPPAAGFATIVKPGGSFFPSLEIPRIAIEARAAYWPRRRTDSTATSGSS